MSEFIYLLRGSDTTGSPKQMRKKMEKWIAWFKQLNAEGHGTAPLTRMPL